jgi:hypothetical protein
VSGLQSGLRLCSGVGLGEPADGRAGCTARTPTAQGRDQAYVPGIAGPLICRRCCFRKPAGAFYLQPVWDGTTIFSLMGNQSSFPYTHEVFTNLTASTNSTSVSFSGAGQGAHHYVLDDVNVSSNSNVSVAPEPSAIGMLLAGLAALGGAEWRRRWKHSQNRPNNNPRPEFARGRRPSDPSRLPAHDSRCRFSTRESA